jgi:hypothetical protein
MSVLDLARKERSARIVAQRLVLVAAVIATFALLVHAFRDLALSHDHSPHCFAGYQFWTEMLGRGRLRGWSHFWAFGYPAGELTPFGAEVWLALFHALTLGLLSWIHSYAVALAAMLMFTAHATFLFARRFLGTLAGVIAAALWVCDPGGWYQGGWFWYLDLGVWPVALAMAMVLLALVKLADVLSPERAPRRRWDATWASFWIAASLVTHLLPLVVYPIAVPCLWCSERIARGRLPAGATARLAASVGIGLGIAAFSLVPTWGRSDLTLDLGVAGYPLSELARRIVHLRLFDNGAAPLPVLAVVGGALALRKRLPAAWFFVACGAIFVLLSSNLAIGVLHLERLSKGLVKLEWPRMLLVAKLFWFPLAGHAVAVLLRKLPAPAGRGFWGWSLAAVVVIALGATLLRPATAYVYRTQIDKSLWHREATPLWRDLQAFFAWSAAERRSTGDFYRIAYKTEPHEHIFTLAPIFNQTPIYKVGYTSAQSFRSFPMTDEPDLLEALSVKYLVADSELADPSLVLDRTFGGLRVYRFERYRPQHPFTLIGGGEAELVQLEPERIQLRLHGIAPGTRLKLHVAAYPRWEATLDGRRLPISPATAYGIEYPFLMEVPAADGDLIFRYRRRALDWSGLAVSGLALVAFVLCALGRLDSLQFPRLRAVARPVAIGVVVLAIGGAAWKLARRAPLATGSPFAIPASRLWFASQPCTARGSGKWSCPAGDVEVRVASGGYGSHDCLIAPPVGPLVFTTKTTLGRFIQVSYEAGIVPGSIRVYVDDRLAGETATRVDGPLTPAGLIFLQFDTRSFAGQLARLRFALTGGPLSCFDASIVP